MAAGTLLPAGRLLAAPLPAMTEGPFYPSRSWRASRGDWDADLTQVRDRGTTLAAQGEHLALLLRVADATGRAVDGVEVEIWQCDAQGVYRHPRGGDGIDPGFQGFGAGRSDAQGALAFRTIRPVPYAGRTPHIHVKLRHASFGETTSQLFVAGEAGNARDFLWQRLSAPARAACEMRLEPVRDAGIAWRVRQVIELPG